MSHHFSSTSSGDYVVVPTLLDPPNHNISLASQSWPLNSSWKKGTYPQQRQPVIQLAIPVIQSVIADVTDSMRTRFHVVTHYYKKGINKPAMIHSIQPATHPTMLITKSPIHSNIPCYQVRRDGIELNRQKKSTCYTWHNYSDNRLEWCYMKSMIAQVTPTPLLFVYHY